MTTEPTDAELKALWQLHAADIGGIFYYARAVLAKFGQPAQAAEPVAWLRNTTDPQPHAVTNLKYRSAVDAKAGVEYIPVFAAHQPVEREPVAWKHDCAALLTNDVELWVDACPHCGKPRNAPQPVAREPLSDEQIEALPMWKRFVGLWPETRREIVRIIEAQHGIKGGQQPTQAQAGAVPLDEARRMFDAGWKAAALFCDREDVVADGIIGFGACPQVEAAFSAAHGIKGGQS